jgi:hypothetical protein
MVVEKFRFKFFLPKKQFSNPLLTQNTFRTVMYLSTALRKQKQKSSKKPKSTQNQKLNIV